jgi:hypothetical protein
VQHAVDSECTALNGSLKEQHLGLLGADLVLLLITHATSFWLRAAFLHRVPYVEFQEAANRAITTKHAPASTQSNSSVQSPASGSSPQQQQHASHPCQQHQRHSQHHVTSSSRGVSQQQRLVGGGGGAVAVPGVLPGGSVSSLCELPFLLTTEAKSKILRVSVWEHTAGACKVCSRKDWKERSCNVHCLQILKQRCFER